MKRLFCLMIFLTTASAVRAELPVEVINAPEVRNVLSGRFIRIEADGNIAGNFKDLLTVNRRPDLHLAVQKEYAAMLLEEGKTPAFTIEEIGPGKYFYLNREKHESYVTELLRNQLSDGTLHAVYSITGNRFFGDFAAVVHVEIAEKTFEEIVYYVEVYAVPENKFFRVVARGLRFAVESFFERKTRFMTAHILDVCSRLINEPPPAAAGQG